LSAQVAELEGAVGTRLFERGRGGVLLTPAGAEFVQRARLILLAAGELVESTQQLADPLNGTLRIGVIPTIAPYLLPDLDPALRREFPGLQLRWTEEKTATLVRLLTDGELDAALLARESDLGDLATAVVGVDDFVLAVPQEHPLASQTQALRLESLQGERVLLLADGHCFGDQAAGLCAAAGVADGGFRATSLSTLAQMAGGGAGPTLLPKMAVEVENRRSQLVIREFSQPAPHRTVVLAWRRSSPLAPSLERLGSFARASWPEPRGS
jgi:LysR family hydrogen peroxide-inducible transcriptional activator